MELKICREGEWRPQCLGGSARVGEEILLGREAEVGWEDVFTGGERDEHVQGEGEVQREMDGRVGIGRW